MRIVSRIIIGFSFACLVFATFCTPMVLADTPLEDVSLKLSIETLDGDTDYDDEGETIPRGSTVIYALEVKNEVGRSISDLRLFMDSPDFMEYKAGSTTIKDSFGTMTELEDEEGYSPLALGYYIEELPAGEIYTFEAKYQVVTNDDPSYTVAWASLMGPYSAIPVLSNIVNTTIEGEPVGRLNVKVTPNPAEETTVFSNSIIAYEYLLTNGGGKALKNATLYSDVPEGATCLRTCSGAGECIENSCALYSLGFDLEPDQSEAITMYIQVISTDPDKEYITHTGYGLSHTELEREEHEKIINHPLNAEIEVGSGEFTLFTEQVPNLVLNSHNGQPRPDEADITETQYRIQYTGTHRTNFFHDSGDFGVSPRGPSFHDISCKEDVEYPHHWGAQVYAYNSMGGVGTYLCEDLDDCPILSSDIFFNITTTLPSDRPSLVVVGTGSHTRTGVYVYEDGNANSVNRFMSQGGWVNDIPEDFTLARAIEDGDAASSESFANAIVKEDLWMYTDTGEEERIGSCPCGDESCPVYKPIYKWEKISSTNITPMQEGDDDTAQISVYSSTAWLKTEGGHIGTSGRISSEETESNKVDLPFGNEKPYMDSNEYVKNDFYTATNTPTGEYTKFGGTNADYMIFANGGNDDGYVSAAGDKWVVAGTDLGTQQHGDPYDRENNPRNYTDDLLLREKFGQVYTDQLPTTLQGTVDIGDDVVWHQTGNLNIGTEGVADAVTFTGGQSRIYVEGDVYINANIDYGTSSGSSYNDVTSLRIDAQNIYVSGEVSDLEVLLQARGAFHSGESHDQLRILGDVITDNAHWERKPVLEIDPDDVNKPSEHIIEDFRKYVIPVPGDTELPDEYDIWRQVNPSTGQVLDAY